jgi:hypothetical protein
MAQTDKEWELITLETSSVLRKFVSQGFVMQLGITLLVIQQGTGLTSECQESATAPLNSLS